MNKEHKNISKNDMNDISEEYFDQNLNHISKSIQEISLEDKYIQIEKHIEKYRSIFYKEKLYEKLKARGYVLDQLRKTNMQFLAKLQFLSENQVHYKEIKQHELDIVQKFKTDWILKFLRNQSSLFKQFVQRKKYNDEHKFQCSLQLQFQKNEEDGDFEVNFDMIDSIQIIPSRNMMLNIISIDPHILSQFKSLQNYVTKKFIEVKFISNDFQDNNEIIEQINTKNLFETIQDDYNDDNKNRKITTKFLLNALKFDNETIINSLNPTKNESDDEIIKDQIYLAQPGLSQQANIIFNKLKVQIKEYLADIIDVVNSDNITVFIKKFKLKQVKTDQDNDQILCIYIIVNIIYNKTNNDMKPKLKELLIESLKIQEVEINDEMFQY